MARYRGADVRQARSCGHAIPVRGHILIDQNCDVGFKPHLQMGRSVPYMKCCKRYDAQIPDLSRPQISIMIQHARRFVGRAQNDRSGLRPGFRSDGRQCRVPGRGVQDVDAMGKACLDLGIQLRQIANSGMWVRIYL
jgi:hypothetical protein